jgi:hypothetical protein
MNPIEALTPNSDQQAEDVARGDVDSDVNVTIDLKKFFDAKRLSMDNQYKERRRKMRRNDNSGKDNDKVSTYLGLAYWVES